MHPKQESSELNWIKENAVFHSQIMFLQFMLTLEVFTNKNLEKRLRESKVQLNLIWWFEAKPFFC